MTKLEDVRIKLERTRNYMSGNGLDVVLLATTANFAWITSGGDDHVELNNKAGVARVVITRDKVFVVTDNIEAARLTEEELEGLDFEVIESEWYDTEAQQRLEVKLIGGLRCASDVQRPDMPCVSDQIATLRYSLTPLEIERYRWLGPHSSMAVEKTARGIEPGMSEIAIAGAMARNLMEDGMTPVVLLVANDARKFKFRHPMPTERRMVNYSMLVCCARRWGLVTSRTRSVSFGKLDKEFEDRYRKVCYVDAVFMAATRTGVPIAEVFQKAEAAYAKVGYPDEWKLMHQGGSIGYESRDYIGSPSCKEKVAPNQAFTWNPTIQGTKSEDTIISNSGSPELITLTGEWPTMSINVEGIRLDRPEILVR